MPQSQQPLDVVRVTEAWVEARQGRFSINLDPAGIGPGDIPLPDDSTTFAIVSAIMAQGKPVYYSYARGAISTDPFFGTNPGTVAGDGPAQEVVDADAIWNFSERSGALLLTLEKRGQKLVEFSDPLALVGWLLTIFTHEVQLVNGELRSRRP